ncbi:MAG: undecaprenyldiphospho-muramoylpentapeptide beta-N-acetylglucosaminyltransferase [Ignavibacteriaceae bacterium]|nr:undecaprenyldiphospho-muramoylpentapeptide beta-N-acetylglucosaminyltransferase [Ignavibacteriaceae bacterium]
MSSVQNKYRFLFAGGGTGGHLFPAVAVAEQIKEIKPEADILFIGTKDRIEGGVVPKLGFKFKSIWIKGFSRKINFENLLFPVKLIVSMIQSLIINMSFKPKVAIGSGGYVAGPAIWAASVMGAKIILIEQNSYPGVTTRLLERYANEIHLSFQESKKYLRREKIHYITGNPVRKNLGRMEKTEALKKFELTDEKKTLLVLGGSLGAKTINEAMAENINVLEQKGFQIIWQTGKNYFEQFKMMNSELVKVYDFIDDMNAAYSACDLLLARAGATTIAELLNLGIPALLVPSPNVAENHQYHNAKSLSDNRAAIMIDDKDLKKELLKNVLDLLNSEKSLSELRKNALAMAKSDAAKVIAQNAIKFAEAV